MKHTAVKHFTKWLNYFERDSQEFTDEINNFLEKESIKPGRINVRIIDIKYTVTTDPYRKEETICSLCKNGGNGEFSHECGCEEEEATFLLTAFIIYEWNMLNI